MRVLALLLPFTILAAAAPPAGAAIHACETASGSIQFQDRPCALRPAAPAPVPTRSGAAARTASDGSPAPPLDIDPSWFERPGATAREALCDARGCECGSLERPFEGGLSLAVADALYLDGAWHRFEAGLVALASPDADGTAVQLARLEIDDAACDVLMSQETLARHGEGAFRTLRRRAVQARDLGRDTPLACDGFDPAACRDYEALELFRRMDQDVRALERPRDPSSTREGGTEASGD